MKKIDLMVVLVVGLLREGCNSNTNTSTTYFSYDSVIIKKNSILCLKTGLS